MDLIQAIFGLFATGLFLFVLLMLKDFIIDMSK